MSLKNVRVLLEEGLASMREPRHGGTLRLHRRPGVMLTIRKALERKALVLEPVYKLYAANASVSPGKFEEGIEIEADDFEGAAGERCKLSGHAKTSRRGFPTPLQGRRLGREKTG